MTTISVNEIVYVYLTDRGRQVYESYRQSKAGKEYPSLTESDTGASWWYLYELFKIFGPNIREISALFKDHKIYTSNQNESTVVHSGVTSPYKNKASPFALFCASIGTVVEYKEQEARIDIGSKDHSCVITLGLNFAKNRNKWFCTNNTNALELPSVKVVGDTYRQAYEKFIKEYTDRVKDVIFQIRQIIADIPEYSGNTFAWLAELGPVLSFSKEEYSVGLYILGKPNVFQKKPDYNAVQDNIVYELFGHRVSASNPKFAFNDILVTTLTRLENWQTCIPTKDL